MLTARERQELAREAAPAVGGVGDGGQLTAALRIALGLSRQGLGVGQDHHQEVVEVVRHAAGELSDRFHLAGVGELFLQRAAVADVEQHSNDLAGPPAVGIGRVDALVEEGAVLAVGAPPAHLHGIRLAGLPRLLDRCDRSGDVVKVQPRSGEAGLLRKGLRWEAGYRFDCL